jgi:hypothetical protein
MLKPIFSLLIVLVITAGYSVVSGQGNKKKYESTEYKFSVEYPENWSLSFPNDYHFKDKRKENTGIISLSSPVMRDGDQPNAGIINICIQPLDSVLDNLKRSYCGRRDDHLSDKDKIISREQTKIDGVDAEIIKTKLTYEEVYIYYVTFSTKNRSFLIKARFRKSSNEVWDTFKYEPEFDRIIETLKIFDIKNG